MWKERGVLGNVTDAAVLGSQVCIGVEKSLSADSYDSRCRDQARHRTDGQGLAGSRRTEDHENASRKREPRLHGGSISDVIYRTYRDRDVDLERS